MRIFIFSTLLFMIKLNKHQLVQVSVGIWLCFALMACHEPGSNKSAIHKVRNGAEKRIESVLDVDSVLCYVFSNTEKDTDGKIMVEYIQEYVLKSKQFMLSSEVFIEVFSTDSMNAYFVYNVEAVRRQFVNEGFDPVLVSTRKRPRKLVGYGEGFFGFSLVQQEAEYQL